MLNEPLEPIGKDDYVQWKHNPVTKQMMFWLRLRIQALQEELGEIAGRDPTRDRYLVGAIRAYKDVAEINLEEITNNES